MVLDEFYVRKHGGKILPAWKRLRVNDQPIQFAMFLDIWIDNVGEHIKVACVQGCYGFNNKDAVIFEKFVFNHFNHPILLRFLEIRLRS